jgi:hypothetical protein
MPDTTGGKKHEIGVKMIFGKTELEFRALNKRTGEEINVKFVFLDTKGEKDMYCDHSTCVSFSFIVWLRSSICVVFI